MEDINTTYQAMTEEEITKSVEETVARRDKIMERMLEVKKAELYKLTNLVKDQDRIKNNFKERAKIKRKASRKARRINRSK
jgi:hypothetical protein